jgi:putative N6-adenine-specific DNA methylase
MAHAHAEGVLVDCMCGSGTILIEAALMALNIAPGLLRDEWKHCTWPDFDSDAWQQSVASARNDCREDWGGVIAGCDQVQASLHQSFLCCECLHF